MQHGIRIMADFGAELHNRAVSSRNPLHVSIATGAGTSGSF